MVVFFAVLPYCPASKAKLADREREKTTVEFIDTGMILALAVLLAAMSPGPDFIVVVRHALGESRRAGVMTALGLGAGVCVHVSYCLSGLAAMISHSIVLFSALKVFGAIYLLYLGWGALRSKGMTSDRAMEPLIEEKLKMSSAAAFRKGFLTNLLNPKATLFFLAVFTQIVAPHTPVFVLVMYGLICATVVVLWFMGVAVVLTTAPMRLAFIRASRWIDRACGAFLIFMGVRLALTKAPVP